MALNNMNKPQFTALQVMQDAPVIPVIVLNDVAHAVPMARALVAGGIRMLEVTLRTPQALACMEAIPRKCPMPWWARVPCAVQRMPKQQPTQGPNLRSVQVTPRR